MSHLPFKTYFPTHIYHISDYTLDKNEMLKIPRSKETSFEDQSPYRGQITVNQRKPGRETLTQQFAVQLRAHQKFILMRGVPQHAIKGKYF